MTTRTPQRRATIVHGYGATPADHWFGDLAGQLRRAGVATTIPALPDPLDPDPAAWTAAVRAAAGAPDENSIIVAHSLGCLTALRHLRALPAPSRLGTLVLVAGFTEPLPALPGLDAYIADGCDVEGLADRIDHLTVLRSDADPVVPPGHTDRLARRLGTTAEIVPGAGHFLATEGITSLPQALTAALP
ncbi:serine hydrolase family protein [Actinomadura sp. LD22]|uniref:Serine hydrolase family protein n=1 Tax=Actinomadura physcomitrii TaxID=2650748 RepID=A0A6I4MP51_9ACTN|nr:alpha/beta hydrolase [Actinomadura physcomitrii]MWA05637.1 serine hydrolase family protein [Actinomadura physcomitrii]